MSPTFPAVATVRCLVIAGDDARRFAQAQFTSDVNALATGHWQWSAWLDPAGRVRALMQLCNVGDDRLVALLRGGDADGVRSGLVPFLLRARAAVTLESRVVRAGPPLPAGELRARDDGIALGLGDRSALLDPAPAAVVASARAAWRLADIRAGWPNLPTGDARLLAPALGLGRLGALALDKGCYPGQEIVARLHYRGGHSRCLYHVRAATAPALGERTTQGGTRRVYVLDVEPFADGGFEALVIAPENGAGWLEIDETRCVILADFTRGTT
jgi:folate-binding protein YgfZ